MLIYITYISSRYFHKDNIYVLLYRKSSSSADNATVSWCCFSVIGAAIIVLGLYALIWGKSKDSTSGGSKGTAAADLPITLAQPNGNGNHELGSGRGVVFDVETPAANGNY